MKKNILIGIAAVLSLTLSNFTQASLVWSGTGNYGFTTANGDVIASPEGGSMGYVSTNNGITQSGLGLGTETNGSTMVSSVFSAISGDVFSFYFNYITSDGAGYADYAWAQLLDASDSIVATLFTARSTPSGDTVPGFGMPVPSAILNPSSTPIVANATTWNELGTSSGECYDDGCGNTGWIESVYTIASDGQYKLSLGVVNWEDTAYASGMAFDNLTINDVVIGTPVVNATAPGTLGLLALSLLGFAGLRRKA